MSDRRGFRNVAHYALALGIAALSPWIAREALAATADPAPLDDPGPAVVSTASTLEHVSLGDAVARALARNPNALTAQQELDRSRALVLEARAASFPTLTGNGTLARTDRVTITSTTTRDGNTNDVVLIPGQINANATLALPLFAPSRWRAWSHAADGVHIAGANAEEVRREVALGVGRAFLTIAAQRRIVEGDLRAVNDAEAHRDYAQRRFDGKVGNRVDLVRAQQTLATASSRAASAAVGLARSREALGVLLGADGPVDISDAALPALPGLAPALGEAATRRGDLKAFELRRRLTKSIQNDAWTDYMPLVTGLIVPFYQNPPVNAPQTGWQAELLLSWSLYDGGFRYGLERERKISATEARIASDGANREAKSEIRSAWESVRFADSAFESAESAATLAHQALDLATLAYRAGATTNLEVIDAQRAALDADTAAAVAEDDARQARLDLLSASGRFP